MNMTLLDSTLDTVLETTFCTPPTSFATRDWISPVRVSVKKPDGQRLQVLIEAVAQVAHHALSHPRW